MNVVQRRTLPQSVQSSGGIASSKPPVTLKRRVINRHSESDIEGRNQPIEISPERVKRSPLFGAIKETAIAGPVSPRAQEIMFTPGRTIAGVIEPATRKPSETLKGGFVSSAAAVKPSAFGEGATKAFLGETTPGAQIIRNTLSLPEPKPVTVKRRLTDLALAGPLGRAASEPAETGGGMIEASLTPGVPSTVRAMTRIMKGVRRFTSPGGILRPAEVIPSKPTTPKALLPQEGRIIETRPVQRQIDPVFKQPTKPLVIRPRINPSTPIPKFGQPALLPEPPNVQRETLPAGPSVYHETSADDAIDLATVSMDKTGLNVSTVPELALGQSGKGALVEFDKDQLAGKTGAFQRIIKPASQFVNAMEGGEELRLLGGNFQPVAIKSVIIKKDSPISRHQMARARNFMNVERLPNGDFKLTPKTFSSTQATSTAKATSSQKPEAQPVQVVPKQKPVVQRRTVFQVKPDLEKNITGFSYPREGKTAFQTFLEEMKDEVEQGQAGTRIVNRDDEGSVVYAGAQPSSFPIYFQNKGLTKDDVLNILDKALRGSPLTAKQSGVLHSLLEGRVEAIQNGSPLVLEPKTGKITNQKVILRGSKIGGKITKEEEFRLDKTPAQKDLFDSIEKAASNVQSVSGNLLPASGGPRTVEFRIKQELIQKKGRIDLRGHKVESAHDLAAIAQVYRDPRFETFRVFYVKNGIIVSHEGITSRHPSSAIVFLDANDFYRETGGIAEKVKRLQADSVYILHNHPSTSAQPSDEDMRFTSKLTKGLSKLGVTLKSHVIINSGEFAFIVPDANGQLVQYSNVPLNAAEIGKSPLTINERVLGPREVAAVAKRYELQPDRMVVVYVGTSGAVRGIQDIPKSLFFNSSAAPGFFSKQQQIFGGFPFLYQEKADGRVLAAAKDLIDVRAIRDFIHSGGNLGYSGSVAITPKQLQKYRVVEPSGQYESPQTIGESIKRIKAIQSDRQLSNLTVARIRKYFGISQLKQATIPELQRLADYLESFQRGDALLSDKQLQALQDLLKDVQNAPIVPKRVIVNRFGENEEILSKGIPSKILNELFPTVDVKEGHPLIRRVVDKADQLLSHAEHEVQRRAKQLDEMLKKAEASRPKNIGEAIRFGVVPQHREIFLALSGQHVGLTKQEAAVVAYLRNFFKKVRDDLQLEKVRRNYVTHLGQTLLERIFNEGLLPALQNVFGLQEKDGIPVNVMLELDNIIGSDKFFRFALERKGWGKPTMNLRRIVGTYSSLYETKKALDEILPEGQAITQLLLKGRSAIWMKRFLQNLKGRGLDNDFRRGKMGWLAKVADGIIDLGYLKLLGLNYWSGIKNLVAGEANNFIVQDFRNFLAGKQRLISDPKKAYSLMNQAGIMEGAFYDYISKGIFLTKQAIRDVAMIFQRVGEMEIRGSLFLGELTPEEWVSGKITPERVRTIKDTIAVAQGIFTKVDSPLWFQTWYGRLFMQMNRWRVTNAALLRRYALQAAEEVRSGKPGKGVSSLTKAFILYGVGMYLSYELGKAGFKKAARVAQSMAESINNVVEIVTLKPVVDALTNNPTFSVLKELAFTIQELANYIGVPGVQEPRRIGFQRGIEDTFISPVQTGKQIFGIQEKQQPKRLGFGRMQGLTVKRRVRI